MAHRQWKHFQPGSALASSTFSPYRMNRQSPQKTPCAQTNGLGQKFGRGMSKHVFMSLVDRAEHWTMTWQTNAETQLRGLTKSPGPAGLYKARKQSVCGGSSHGLRRASCRAGQRQVQVWAQG